MDVKNIEIIHYANTIVENINLILNERSWSLKKLSDESNVSYDTIKKLMSGQTGCPTIYNLIKISEALGVSTDYLLGREQYHHINYAKLPKRAYTLLSEIASFESSLYDLSQAHGKHYIPVIVPSGCMGDEMIFESMYTDYIDVSPYYNEFGEIMTCGILITNKSLHPTYLENDILLIANDRPPIYGETGIFLKNRHVYIRKYIYGNPSILEPVNGFGSPISVNNPLDWHVFGRVITIVRR